MPKAPFAMPQAFKKFVYVTSACLLISSPIVDAKEKLEESISLAANSHSSSAESQRKIDIFSEKTQETVESILQNDRQSNITEAYNLQLSKLIQSQHRELQSLQVQINSIEETEQAMLPLLNVMLSQLADFVQADVPFLLDERSKRIEKLATLLDRADVSVAEKYRQILEAYLIEVGYGRTIEAYSGTLLDSHGGSDQQTIDEDLATHVNYLRIGRVALYYQSLQGQEGGLWLPTKEQWLSLDSEKNLVVTKAIQIAQQQRVPELLPLPVPTLTSN